MGSKYFELSIFWLVMWNRVLLRNSVHTYTTVFIGCIIIIILLYSESCIDVVVKMLKGISYALR